MKVRLTERGKPDVDFGIVIKTSDAPEIARFQGNFYTYAHWNGNTAVYVKAYQPVLDLRPEDEIDA